MERNGSQEWSGKRIVFVMDELADLKARLKDPHAGINSAIKTCLMFKKNYVFVVWM
ncbi:hypothetical protein [Paenibacillus sp. V4I7]|uniref:hypothetical protein n=1 Tax=Paenibacillus sp. V4I7 TaxID=3042307 RepID=UPI0027D90DA3|nr:hypothetical protein [Paenibacillus sp. V4I7]